MNRTQAHKIVTARFEAGLLSRTEADHRHRGIARVANTKTRTTKQAHKLMAIWAS